MRLDLVILIVGGSTLALEILGARMLAPFHGHGPFLASTVLCVGLLALGVGAAFGGWRADREADRAGLGMPLVAAGLWTLLAPWIRHPLLAAAEAWGLELALVLAAAVLLGPPLALLGSTIPLAVRLEARKAGDPGRIVGSVLALFAAGGAALALACSWWLVPALGVTRTSVLIGLLEVAAGAWAFRISRSLAVASAAALLAGIGAILSWSFGAVEAAPRAGLLARASGTIGELRVIDKDGGRYLLRDGTIHAVIDPVHGVSLDRTAAALEVLKNLRPEPGDLLVFGLRGGSVAKSFEGDGWSVSVVDGDPLAAKLAFEHFGLKPAEVRLTIAEPRRFARRDRGSYGLILLDTFADNVIPPELVSREFFESLAGRLERGGILAIGVEARGWDDALVRALAATLRTRFATVLALPTTEPPNALGGVVVLASDGGLELPERGLPEPYDFISDPFAHWTVVQMNHAWGNRFEPEIAAPVMTDDWNPADLWGERINLAARRELHRFFGPQGRSW